MSDVKGPLSLQEVPIQQKQRECQTTRSVSVTVVIPAFNEERNIARLTEQILAEPWNGAVALDEVIIVDDCSDDDTQAITERLAREHERVRMVRHAQRSGKNAGMRTGIAACRSEIIVFADADVLLGPRCLTMMIRRMAADPALAAVSCIAEPLPARSWHERASRFQLLYVAELGRFGYGALARVYAARTSIMRAFVLPDNTYDDLFIVRWLGIHNHRLAVCSNATVYIRGARGLRDFAKQTVRLWRAGEALERILPPTPAALHVPQQDEVAWARRRKAVRRAMARSISREPLGFILYFIWRSIVRITPTKYWLPVVDHTKYDTSQSTKDLGDYNLA